MITFQILFTKTDECCTLNICQNLLKVVKINSKFIPMFSALYYYYYYFFRIDKFDIQLIIQIFFKKWR